MNTLPEPPARQPHATQAGQTTINADARKFLADLESAYADQQASTPTFYRDDTRPPATGPTPPVTQPGRAPMSQQAVDLNTTILSSSVLAAVLGGSGTAILWASGHANPTVIGWVCACAVAAPAALAIPVLALKSLMKGAKEVVQAAPPQIHQHYSGTVHQDHRSVNTQNRGIWVANRNELPR